ncbi:uncharacterized protein LOC107632985 [Arachis ipaensis]|uniref:uncharacterized protein LOC107632985 n=1 Tax=Arachis ipaensis TaxID=130454 RepID=UPI0007AF1A04|nr:uncharacterized protein LOC107632985 [Arachis ipaensis]
MELCGSGTSEDGVRAKVEELGERVCQYGLYVYTGECLPVYYLSLYKIPKAVANKLIALQRSFLWCKDDGTHGIPLVKWEVVQAPKKIGGLGVGDATLPVKGGPWKDICQLNIAEQQVKEKLISGLAMEVGNRRRMRFWEDNWVQGGPLKASFPRLFSISNQQGSMIGDYGFWDGVEWIWNFSWRRELFQCEMELVHQLHERLRPVALSAGREDNIVLQAETFSEEITSYSFTRSIWGGVVPSRIELFGWFVLIGKVWDAWLRHFDRPWAVPGTMKGLFESWLGIQNRKKEEWLLLVSFFAVIWNIWIERNDRIFNNREAGVEHIQERTFLIYKECLKQHNGDLKAGAKASRAGRPWICTCLICGFADRGEGIHMTFRVLLFMIRNVN